MVFRIPRDGQPVAEKTQITAGFTLMFPSGLDRTSGGCSLTLTQGNTIWIQNPGPHQGIPGTLL